MMFASVKQSGVAVNAPRRLRGASRLARSRANRAAVRCEAGKDEKLPKLPKSPREQVGQAAEAVRRAAADGNKQLAIEFTLPLIGATDLDDWPGGIQQQFKAAAPLVEEILRSVKREPGLEGRIEPRFLDRGDAVGLWEGEGVSCVLFPTGGTLPAAIDASERSRLTLVVNPQWNAGGLEAANVFSEFGFGARRRRCEAFVESLGPETFYLQQTRISGENLKVVRRYPEPYQVVVNTFEGETFVLAAAEAERPSYSRLEELCKARPGSVAAMDFVQRLQYEIEWTKRDAYKNPNGPQ